MTLLYLSLKYVDTIHTYKHTNNTQCYVSLKYVNTKNTY